MEEKERKKKEFYDALYALDQESDSPEETDNDTLLLSELFRRPVVQTNLAKSHITDSVTRRGQVIAPSPSSITRTVSAPLPTAHSPLCPSIEIIKDTPAGHTPVSSHSRIGTAHETTSKSPLSKVDSKRVVGKGTPTMPLKRKRGKSLQLVPQAQQIFKGLHFCKGKSQVQKKTF